MVWTRPRSIVRLSLHFQTIITDVKKNRLLTDDLDKRRFKLLLNVGLHLRIHTLSFKSSVFYLISCIKGPVSNFIIKDLPSVLILIIADQV